MRLVIQGTTDDVEVIAEPFDIEGTTDQFAVHPSLEHLSGFLIGGTWTATHIPTGLVVARADQIDDAITEARAKWASKTPEELKQIIAAGHAKQSAMLAARGAA